LQAQNGQRIRRIGHVVRTDKERTVKRITEWRTIAVRRIGRKGSRREDDVRAGMGIMKIQNRSKMAIGREARKTIGQQAKTRKEM
jgi:hypothetical protein